ncbi:hypothetical protein [Cloacibacillus porcorum]|uniref:hypothetical protein n=1 Tax=Cloacibacillus porcorum TaxID=1197717 RepID=UPI003F11BE3C
MIGCFAKSRMALAAGLVTTAVVTLCVAVRRADGPLWLAVIAVALVLTLGCLLSLLVANMTAAHCDHALQRLLHIDLEPELFVKAYEPVALSMRPGRAGRVIAAVNLSEGLCAMGEWRRALQVIEEPGDDLPPLRRGALKALVMRSRCRCMLWSGDRDTAERAVAEFKTCIETLDSSNPRLAAEMRRDVELYVLWCSLLAGEKTDTGRLEDLMKKTPTMLAKFDICRMIVLAAKNNEDRLTEERFCRLIASEGGGLACAVQMRRLYPVSS